MLTILELLSATVISAGVLLATSLVKRLCREALAKSHRPASA